MVWAGGDGERGGGVSLRTRCRRAVKVPIDGAVDQHLEVLARCLLLPRWAASKVSV